MRFLELWQKSDPFICTFYTWIVIYKKLASKVMQKKRNIKNYYYFILFLAFGQFSGHDHTILITEYQRNYDVIMSKCYLEN